MFNIIVAGSLFRPLRPSAAVRRRHKLQRNEKRFAKLMQADNDSDASVVADGIHPVDVDSLMKQPVTQSLIHFPTFMKREVSPFYAGSIEKLSQEGYKGKTLHEILLKHDLLDKFHNYNRSTTSTHEPLVKPSSKQVELVANRDTTASRILASDNLLHTSCESRRTRKVYKYSRVEQELLLPLNRKDIFYRGSLVKRRPLANGRAISCPNIAITCENESGSESGVEEGRCSCVRASREVSETFHSMLHLSILHSKVFLYFCLSTFLLYLAYDVPYVFLPDKATDMGVDDSRASLLVSIIGITSTVGQIFLGWVGDFPSVNAMHLYNIVTCFAGLFTCFSLLLFFSISREKLPQLFSCNCLSCI